MKCGRAHAGLLSKIVDSQRLGEIAFYPPDGTGDLLALTVGSGDLTQPLSLITHQQPIDDLTLDHRRENQNVLLVGEQADQALESIHQGLGQFAGRHAAARLLAAWRREIAVGHELSDLT